MSTKSRLAYACLLSACCALALSAANLVAEEPTSKFADPQQEAYWLGVACYPVGDALRAQLDLPEGTGIVVAQVFPDSPAAKVGLKQHDILLSMADKPLKELADLIKGVEESKDKAVAISLLRGGKPLSVEVAPIKRPVQDHLIAAPGVLSGTTFPHATATFGTGDVRYVVGPGMMLPPGVGLHPPLPADMTVTVTKQGGKPAEVTVKQGDKTWTTTEDALEKLPEELRGHAAGVMGRIPPGMTFNIKLDEQPFDPTRNPPGMMFPGARMTKRVIIEHDGAGNVVSKEIIEQEAAAPVEGTPATPGKRVIVVEGKASAGGPGSNPLEDIARHLAEQQQQLQKLAEELRQLREEVKGK